SATGGALIDANVATPETAVFRTCVAEWTNVRASASPAKASATPEALWATATTAPLTFVRASERRCAGGRLEPVTAMGIVRSSRRKLNAAAVKHAVSVP